MLIVIVILVVDDTIVHADVVVDDEQQDDDDVKVDSERCAGRQHLDNDDADDESLLKTFLCNVFSALQ